MITPGKDFNYPTSSGNVGSFSSYMPHTLVGVLVAVILLMIAWHLLTRRRRR